MTMLLWDNGNNQPDNHFLKTINGNNQQKNWLPFFRVITIPQHHLDVGMSQVGDSLFLFLGFYYPEN